MSRTIDFKYVIVRGGADYGELQALPSSPPRIRADDGAEIKTSLNGSFAPHAEIDWMTDEIRPELILNGVSYPLGVFLPASVTFQEDETSRSVQVEAYDRCWVVRDTKTETVLSFPAGQTYQKTITDLLAMAGIAIVNMTPSSATLAETREDWPVGTSVLQIVNELAAEINYAPLWFDELGAAILEPAALPSAENVDHVYNEREVSSMILPQLSRSTDIYSAPNVFVCVCSNPDKSGPMVATAENNMPTSPLSIARRGRRITQVEKLKNIANQAELQAYADRLVNQSLLTGETIELQTALMPGHGVGDAVALLLGGDVELCVEHAWSMDLSVGGTMTHTLEKVVSNL